MRGTGLRAGGAFVGGGGLEPFALRGSLFDFGEGFKDLLDARGACRGAPTAPFGGRTATPWHRDVRGIGVAQRGAEEVQGGVQGVSGIVVGRSGAGGAGRAAPARTPRGPFLRRAAHGAGGRRGGVGVVNQSKLELLSQLWGEFRKMAFPRGFGIREPEGECMALTDTLVAGCIHTALNNKGSLDGWRRGVLQDRIEALVKVLPALADDEYATEYFTRLHRMAVLAAGLSADAACAVCPTAVGTRLSVSGFAAGWSPAAGIR
ncbi:hypothetical protein [Streptodolium elevatio]|uniref:Uncharacterized protein n=1 Tax=Streptodolium elevatio TaxID=3157996 RepID=A0ABV3DPX0_9ACTN